MDAEMRPAPASPQRVRETDDSFQDDVRKAAQAEADAREADREGESGEDKQAENDEAYMQLARDRAQVGEAGWQDNFNLFRKDIEFLSGTKQWPEKIEQEREDRVRLTLNQLPKFVRQVLNDGKQNRISIKVSPIEGNSNNLKLKNQAGTRDYTLAQVMEGIVRNIETISKAESAYDKALEYAVQGGFGWLKVEKRYARPDGFEQELVIRPVRNPYAIIFDPAAMTSNEPNFTGGKWAFEVYEYARKEAEALWGNVTEFDVANEGAREYWSFEDKVRIARYWRVEEKDVTYVLLSTGAVMTKEDALAAAPEHMKAGTSMVAERQGKKRCVYWCDIDGSRKLTAENKWDGGYIPLIPVLGPEMWLDGKVIYESLIRHSHDAQRMYNYWRSAATEAVALAPKAPWILDMKAVDEAYLADYRAASEEPQEYVRFKSGPDRVPPKRLDMAGNPAAEIQQSLQANDDIKGTLGLYDASIGNKSNETSGVAIQRRQQEGDVGTYNWHDALAKAIGHVGVVLVDLIPKVYDTERLMRLRTPDDGEDFVQINHSIPGKDGQMVKADLAAQRYDVAVSTGPSVTTQRLAAAESQLEFLGITAKVSPQHAGAILDKVAKSMDWENADDIAKRLRKMLPPALLEPDEQAELENEQQGRGDGQPQGPTPEEIAQRQAAEVAQKEADAKMIAAEADLIAAKAKLAEAQAMAPENVRDLVAQAIADLMSGAPPPATGTGAPPMHASQPATI